MPHILCNPGVQTEVRPKVMSVFSAEAFTRSTRGALKARNRSAQGGAAPPKVATRNPGYSAHAVISPERAAQSVSPFQGLIIVLSETQGFTLGCSVARFQRADGFFESHLRLHPLRSLFAFTGLLHQSQTAHCFFESPHNNERVSSQTA